MFPKVNISNILLSHIRTLRSYSSKKSTWRDWLTFFVLPVFVGILFSIKFNLLGKDIINLLITILSILAGFSFNLLAIIFGYRDKIKRKIKDDDVLKKIYIREIHSNISFSVLNAILCIGLLLLNKLTTELLVFDFNLFQVAITLNLFDIVVSFSTYFCLMFYFLTILMILKRLSILFEIDIKESET
jgi:hypothetical protein